MLFGFNHLQTFNRLAEMVTHGKQSGKAQREHKTKGVGFVHIGVIIE
jgi:hypothetical protein